MAFTRSGVRSPSPPLTSRTGEAGEVGEVGAVEPDPTERLDWEWHAGIAQLVEHNLAKVGVAGSSPVSRSGHGLTDKATRGGAVW